MKRLITLSLLLSLSLAARAENPVYTVTIDPAGVPRKQVPVTIELRTGRELTAAEAERLSNGAKVTIDGMLQVQADVSHDAGGNAEKILIHYVERGLPAGEKRTLRVSLEPECECEATGFRFDDHLDYRDLWYDAWPIYRHMIAYDSENHADTFMPFHHLYGFHDEGYITKGPGGDYPHHRGLYWSWNTNQGNFWTGAGGVSQRFHEYVEGIEKLGRVTGRKIVKTNWCNKAGKPVARDTRDVRAYAIDDGWFVMDFTITTEAIDAPLVLKGDAHHAGFHFRAAQEVSGGGTKGSAKYLHPSTATKEPNSTFANAPWMAMQFAVQNNPYTIAILDHATNPKPTVFSTRAYGRMGAFFTHPDKSPVTIEPGKPLTVRYRVLILDGKKWSDIGAEKIDTLYSDFVSPVKVTVERAN